MGEELPKTIHDLGPDRIPSKLLECQSKTIWAWSLFPTKAIESIQNFLLQESPSRMLEDSLPKTLKHKTLMVSLQSLDLARRVWKAPQTLSFMSSTSAKRAPLTLTLVNRLLLLWALAILWKNPVFLPPSLNQISLGFCLQEVSSNKSHFLNSS